MSLEAPMNQDRCYVFPADPYRLDSKSSLIAVGANSVAFAICLTVFSASFDELPVHGQSQVVIAPQTFLQEAQQLLATVKSYELEGTLEVRNSDELMAKIGPGRAAKKLSSYRFHEFGKGASLKLRLDQLVRGKATRTEVFYVDSEKVVIQEPDGSARVSFLKKAKKKLGLLDRSPAFLEYSFLQPAMDIYGIWATPPLDLADREKWKSSLERMKPEPEKMGEFSIHRTDGLTVVELADSQVPGRPAYPKKTTFFNANGTLLSIVEVVEQVVHPQLGMRPRIVTLKTFLPEQNGTGSMPVATRTFQIDRFEVNKDIEESDIAFDPASAKSIWDSENDILIEVPR